MKQVPEEKNAPTREEQLKSLLGKLTGHEIFKACRGKLYDPFYAMIEKSENPSQFCSSWDELSPMMRVMGNLLSVYKRDGWTYAYDALRMALQSKCYLLPGETVPLEQTVPVTVLMPETKKTLTFIRWLLCAHWGELDDYLDEKDGIIKQRFFHPLGLTHKLFDYFPTLEDHSRKRRKQMDYEGWDLKEAYNDAVIKPLDSIVRPLLESLNGKPLYLGRSGGTPQWNDHIEEVGHIPLAYFFYAEAREVLKNFSRKQQKEMCTWSFNFPKIETQAEHLPNIGLHVQQEHQKWHKEFPMYASLGISRNLGAILIQSSLFLMGDEYSFVRYGNYSNNKEAGLPPRFCLSPR